MSKYTKSDFEGQVLFLKSNECASHSNKDFIIKSLTSITEALVWSEQNKVDFFTFFCESEVLQTYSSLLNQEFDKTIIIQLLQSSTILIHNLKDSSCVDSLLSSGFYCHVLSHPFDFTDEEITENYMSLIKGLAVNLSLEQVEKYLVNNHFALFTGAMMFFYHREQLIRTCSRTVVLRVLTVNDEVVQNFIWESGFFVNLISNLRESIFLVETTAKTTDGLGRLEQVIAEFDDLLYHINDIFELNVTTYNSKLTDLLLKLLVLPIMTSSLIEAKPKKHHISMSIALLTISHMLSIINYELFYNELLLILFKKDLPVSYYNTMTQPPNRNTPILEKSLESTQNDISSTLLSFLRCKEDNLIGLSLSIIQSIFHHSLPSFFSNPDLDTSFLSSCLIEILSSILLADEELRFFSCFLTCKLFLQLFESNIQSLRPSDLLETAKSAKVKHGEVILAALQVKQNEGILNKFEQEWDFVRSLKWNENLELPLNYILPSLDEIHSMIPLHHRRNCNEDDAIRTELRLFMLFRKLFRMMSGETGTERNPLIVDLDSDVKVGKKYSTEEGTWQNRKMVKIYEKYYNRDVKYIVDDPYWFIIATLNYNGTLMNVEELSRYTKISIVERPEPNLIVLNIENSRQLTLFFVESFEWIQTKNKLEKRMKEHRERELKIFKEFLNS